MGVLRDVIPVLITIVYCYIVIQVIFPIVNASPVEAVDKDERSESIKLPQDVAEDRMVKPPRFPYDGPFGFYSSGLLCVFDSTPYIGGWFGRSCAGPIAPFIQPTPPPNMPAPPTFPTPAPTPAPLPQPIPNSQVYTQEQLQWMQTFLRYLQYQHNQNQQASAGYDAGYGESDDDEEYVEPVEGNPWEPDDDGIFIENRYGVSASRPGFKLGDPSRYKK